MNRNSGIRNNPNDWSREHPEGTPFDARSLPYAYKNKSYNVYEVIKPISGVQSGTTAPSFWFNTQGGGTQYLLQNGYIKPIF